ncbi:DUF167 domain-containing protein [Desulfobulbus oralis]|uniref:UPF0235 protein CAY53_03760 n=1 Tax=Desulfobulbus oralis TaxID=1986146 RepID=A0A2L1GM35_9BACT|nr:DUF167 domain-containing protein [Desulfobulbus oralis]AVD70708.1 YggU family protein [Desulfobulbus oralis]
MPFLSPQSDGSMLLHVHVQPRAAQNQIAGLMNNALKLRLTAPPVDGQANRAVLAVLAKALGLPKSAVSLKSGGQGRQKTLRISGMSEADIRAALAPFLQQGDPPEEERP